MDAKLVDGELKLGVNGRYPTPCRWPAFRQVLQTLRN
jgi:hypothetical protein